MDDRMFWSLIDEIDREALLEGDEDAAVGPLIEALAGRDEAEILAFADALANRLHAIDGLAHAKESGESSGSDDGFLYARCHVVARGREHYEAVAADPSKMPKTPAEWCEALLAVAPIAWAEATGRTEDDWDHVSPDDYETGANKAQWPDDDQD